MGTVAVLALFATAGVAASTISSSIETPLRVRVDAVAVPRGARVRVELMPSLRVLGVRFASADETGGSQEKSLETVFEGPAAEPVNLEFLRTDTRRIYEAETTFGFDPATLKGIHGPHLGFVRLVGTWQLETPGKDDGTWSLVTREKVDSEAPVLGEALDHPSACMTIEPKNDGYYAFISDSCGSLAPADDVAD